MGGRGGASKRRILLNKFLDRLIDKPGARLTPSMAQLLMQRFDIPADILNTLVTMVLANAVLAANGVMVPVALPLNVMDPITGELKTDTFIADGSWANFREHAENKGISLGSGPIYATHSALKHGADSIVAYGDGAVAVSNRDAGTNWIYRIDIKGGTVRGIEMILWD